MPGNCFYLITNCFDNLCLLRFINFEPKNYKSVLVSDWQFSSRLICSNLIAPHSVFYRWIWATVATFRVLARSSISFPCRSRPSKIWLRIAAGTEPKRYGTRYANLRGVSGNICELHRQCWSQNEVTEACGGETISLISRLLIRNVREESDQAPIVRLLRASRSVESVVISHVHAIKTL